MVKFLTDRIAESALLDEKRLNKLGYKQELQRKLSYFHNFGVAISFLSPITGLTGTYGYSLAYGGPVTIIWGWVLVSMMNIILAMVLAEICSSFPTSGGVYFFAHRLAGLKYGAICSWIAGWFNLLGGAACTAGVAFTSAQLVANYILMSTGTAAGGGYLAPQAVLLAIYGIILLVMGLTNVVAAHGLAGLYNFSVWFHAVGVTAFVIALPLVAPTHQPASWVFTAFAPDTAYSGIFNSGFTFLLGLLGSQWAMVGYDTAAHMVEETVGAEISGPISLLSTVVAGFVMGFAFLLSVTFSIQDPTTIFDAVGGATASVAGNPVFGIVHSAFVSRTGSAAGAMALMVVPLVCSQLCGTACVTANSRMLFAFSRDGGLPGSSIFRKVYWGGPTNAIFLAVVLAFILGLPMLNSHTAFAAITSVGVVGVYISYAVPVFFHAFASRGEGSMWVPGRFSLGRWSRPLALVSSVWITFICSLFVLPQVYPVNSHNLNYAPVTVACVIAVSGAFWLVSARKWFEGPVGDPNVMVLDPEEVDPDTADASVIAGNDYNSCKADMMAAAAGIK